MSIKNFGMKTIHSLLSEHIYYIPDHQREYSWGEDELEDFWQDLKDTQNGRDVHFFGQIVIHHDTEEEKYYIIDGQQRTTTTVILLSVLRDMFKSNDFNNYEDAKNNDDDIRIKYIGRYTKKKDELRLHLGELDSEYFKNNIQRSHPIECGETSSQKRIYSAYNFLKRKLNEEIECSKNDIEKSFSILNSYLSTILNKFHVMSVTTDDMNEAYIIFETLNARGKELETSDLLKNYIFMKSKNNLKKVKREWTSMFESLDNSDEATRFIRYYWNSRYDFTREKMLYKKITKVINETNTYEFVHSLKELVDLYNSLSKPKENKFYADDDIENLLKNLSIVDAKSFYPIIFALKFKNFKEAEIKNILKCIEVIIFRNCIVAGKTANTSEILFARIAREISNEDKQYNSIIEDITSATNNDEKFVTDLKGIKIKKASVAKYILREIEDYNNKELIISRDNRTINLEHIMPKNKSKWDISDKIHDDYLYRLSNQTLLLEEYNKSISNAKFEEKKDTYCKSKIEMTKKLSSYDKWDVEAMEKREQELIETILKRWALMK